MRKAQIEIYHKAKYARSVRAALTVNVDGVVIGICKVREYLSDIFLSRSSVGSHIVSRKSVTGKGYTR